MSSYYRELIRMLEEAGCVFEREAKGSHEWWYSPKTQRKFVVVKDINKRHTANEILKQAGLQKKF